MYEKLGNFIDGEWINRGEKGENVLIYGGTSGVGIAAIQIAKDIDFIAYELVYPSNLKLFEQLEIISKYNKLTKFVFVISIAEIDFVQC